MKLLVMGAILGMTVAFAAPASAAMSTADCTALWKKADTNSDGKVTGEEGKMYGSVTTKDIEDAFAAAGVKIDRKKIVLADAIKSVGTFEVPIKLHANVTATLKVNVTKK